MFLFFCWRHRRRYHDDGNPLALLLVLTVFVCAFYLWWTL